MILLALAAMAFVALHILPATPLRARTIATLGENAYLGVFATASLIIFILWTRAFVATPRGGLLWYLPAWWPFLKAALMVFVAFLFVGGLSSPNPMEMKGGKLIARPTGAGGIYAVARHPLLTSMGLWGVLHLISQPEWRGFLLHGVVALVAFVGQALIDMRKSAMDAASYAQFTAKTSRVPFVALIQGRASLNFGEIGLPRAAVALVLWATILASHNWLYSASPLPGIL